MRQKVGIAIAYAKDAQVYLLMNLQVDWILCKQSVIRKWRMLATDGATILMASHDIFRVRESCDRIGILKQGKLLHEVLSSDVTSNELELIFELH